MHIVAVWLILRFENSMMSSRDQLLKAGGVFESERKFGDGLWVRDSRYVLGFLRT